MKEEIIDIRGIHTKIPENLKEFDPSYITRYAITAELIRRVTSRSKKKMKILDVGGYNGALQDFLPQHDITIVDMVDDSKLKNYIKASGAKMPFKDNQFDVVVSCDTLEHIKPNERDDFISEMLRVSKNNVFICAPFGTKRVEDAELMADSFYKSMAGESYIWLKEHRDFGLPQKKWLRDKLKSLNCNFDEFDHSSIDLWTLILSSTFFLAGNIAPVNDDFYKRLRTGGDNYVSNISFIDFPPEGYRTFYAISKLNNITVKTPEYDKSKIDSYFLNELINLGAVIRDINGAYGTALTQLRDVVKANSILTGELRSLRKHYDSIINNKSYKTIEKLSHIKNRVRRDSGKNK